MHFLRNSYKKGNLNLKGLYNYCKFGCQLFENLIEEPEIKKAIE